MSYPSFTVFYLALSAAAHWLIASWAMRAFPRLARHKRLIAALVAVLVLATPALRTITRRAHSPAGGELLAWMMLELMTVLLGIVPLALVVLGARALGGPGAAPPPPADAAPPYPPPPDTLGRRDAIERIGGVAVLGATGAILGWGMVRGRHAFVTEEVPVRIPGLPKALDGYTIAQVSDLHTGVFVGERDLAEGLGLVASMKPDLIVATGDLVDFDPRCAPLLAGALARLRARDGLVAILGNHDYYTGYQEILDALARAQLESLVNRGKVLRAGDGGGFALLGVDDLWARRWGGVGPDLERALTTVPPDRPRILLAHQPNYFAHAAGKVALQLSGHTHGGQINPGFSPAKLLFQYVAGRYERSGSTLYVNRGFGVAGPPARVGAPPEVTKIVLVAA